MYDFDLNFLEKVFDEVVKIAREDNVITSDEQSILETTRKNIDKFKELFEEALEDDILTGDEIKGLEKAYKKIYLESELQAMKDAILTSDEVKLISKIAHTLFSP